MPRFFLCCLLCHHPPPLQVTKDGEAFIADYLSRYGKKLSVALISIITSHPLCSDREILKTLLDELIAFGKFDELDQHIAYLLEAQAPSQFYQKMLECYEGQYGKREVRDFFSIMRLTGYGLRVVDALEMADVGTIDKALDTDLMSSPSNFFKSIAKSVTNIENKPFDQYFKVYLKRDGDLISLNHEHMQQAVDERYLTNDKTVRKYRNKILDDVRMHTNELKDSDKNKGRFEEVAHQMLMLGKRDDLKDFLHDDVVRRYFKQYHPDLYSHFIQA